MNTKYTTLDELKTTQATCQITSMENTTRTVTLQELLAVQEHLFEQVVQRVGQVGQGVVDTLAAEQDTGAVDTSAVAGWDSSAAVHNLAVAAVDHKLEVDHSLGAVDHSLERESRMWD